MSLELGRLDEARTALLTALGESGWIYSHDAVTISLLAESLGIADRVGEFLGRVGGPWVEIARLLVAGEISEASRRLDEAGDLSSRGTGAASLAGGRRAREGGLLLRLR